MRSFHLLAALAMTLSAPAAAQRYEIPDRLAHLNVPADPGEFIRQAVRHERTLSEVWRFGCPSEVGGYAGAVFEMLFETAATDYLVRKEFSVRGAPPEDDCPADFARWKAWYIALVKQEYRAGLYNTGSEEVPVTGGQAALNLLSRDVVDHALVREIARDENIYEPWRVDAVEAMVAHRVQAGTPKLEAERDVMLDMATAPAIHASDMYLDGSSWEWLTVTRLSEHFEGFWCEYNRLAHESRARDSDLPARSDTIVFVERGPRIDPKPCRP